VDTVQLINLFLSVSLHVLNLVLYQRVEFLLFGIPSYSVLAEFSSELLFVVLEKFDFQITFSDLVLSNLEVGLKFFDDSILFVDLLS
jgi:hypothetical protein